MEMLPVNFTAEPVVNPRVLVRDDEPYTQNIYKKNIYKKKYIYVYLSIYIYTSFEV